jgi:transposase
VPIAERVKHVNRIKGSLFSQGVSGYEPPRRDHRRRLGRWPSLAKASQGSVSAIGSNCCSSRSSERDALLAAQQVAAPASAAMALDIKGHRTRSGLVKVVDGVNADAVIRR